MNNKDFLNAVSRRMGISQKEVQSMSNAFAKALSENLDDENSLNVPGFGSFEVKKKLERVVVSPITKKRKLVPPKLALAFKPSSVLKDKIQ
ncbi:MAG: HU family DNA-binding protein [Bacteroidales bacterium]|nr:HU family DNA-binding protein [Bacteroidales bacterium]